MDNIEKKLAKIEERNARVEGDKAWETSWARRIFIGIVTYVVAGIWLVLITETGPWLKALVPAGGYILSTLTIPFLKRWWLRYHQK